MLSMCLVRDVERYSRQDPINGGNIEVVYVLPYYEVATPQLFDLSRHLSVPQLRPTRCSAESSGDLLQHSLKRTIWNAISVRKVCKACDWTTLGSSYHLSVAKLSSQAFHNC